MEEQMRLPRVEVQYLSQRMAIMESKVSTPTALSELVAEIKRLNTRVGDAMSIHPGRSEAHLGFSQAAQDLRSRASGSGPMPSLEEYIPIQSHTVDSDGPAVQQNSYSHSRSPSPLSTMSLNLNYGGSSPMEYRSLKTKRKCELQSRVAICRCI